MHPRLTRVTTALSVRRNSGTGMKRGYASFVVGLCLVAAMFFTGCNSGEEQGSGNQAGAGNSTAEAFKKSDDGTIEAAPNPVPAGAGQGRTKISWRTKADVGDVRVYISENGQPESLFAQNPEGTLEAPWIQTGVAYEFRLYAEKNGRRTLLDRVQVSRSK